LTSCLAINLTTCAQWHALCKMSEI
jgi:hypothetical protein